MTGSVQRMAAPDQGESRSRPQRRHPVLLFIAAQPLGAAGLLVILAMSFAGLFPGLIAPYDPQAVDFASMLAAPSLAHPLGTDAFGRDVLARIVYGAHTALTVGFLSSFIGSIAGAAMGVVAAYFRGTVDLLVQGVTDILLSFPIIVLALVVVAILGKGEWIGVDWNLVAAIAVPIAPNVSRVVRSAALGVREMPYVDAARAAGYSNARIIFRHMAPNVGAPWLIMLTAFTAQAILLEASLSFLGLGVVEPTASWGVMLSGHAADFYAEAPWMILFPGIAISLAVFAFNLVGDSLRDWLDPRLQF
jgi:peptide/nickel transport system permease protein